MEQKKYKRTGLKDWKMEVEQAMEKLKNTIPDIDCYLNIPKSEFVQSTTIPNYDCIYMEELDTEVLHFIDNFDLDNCTINQIRQANEYLEYDLTTSTELQLKDLLNKIDNKIRSKMDDAPFKEYHEDLITGKTKIDINKKTLFVPQKSKEEISMKNEKTYDEIIDKNTTEDTVSVITTPRSKYEYLDKSDEIVDKSGDNVVEPVFSLEDFANEQKEFFDKLYNLGRVKQKEYSRGKSAFHNFERSKDLSFHNTRTKSAWEYMVKHLQSVKDLLDDEERGEYIDPKVVDEKIGDIIIYMTLIRSMLINR